MDQWFKFNDDIVEKAYKFQVYDCNFGGTYKDAKYNKFTKNVEELDMKNTTTAYMLVYLRNEKIKELLQPIGREDIPKRLIEWEENKIKEDEEKVFEILICLPRFSYQITHNIFFNIS